MNAWPVEEHASVRILLQFTAFSTVVAGVKREAFRFVGLQQHHS